MAKDRRKMKRQQFIIKNHHKIDGKLSRKVSGSWIRIQFVLRGWIRGTGQYQTGSKTLAISTSQKRDKERVQLLRCTASKNHSGFSLFVIERTFCEVYIFIFL